MISKLKARKIRDLLQKEDNEEFPEIFDALSDPGRFKIFKMLIKIPDLCVSEIANVLETSVPAASQQLRILEHSGIVKKCRDGQMMCYSLKMQNPMVKKIILFIKQ